MPGPMPHSPTARARRAHRARGTPPWRARIRGALGPRQVHGPPSPGRLVVVALAPPAADRAPRPSHPVRPRRHDDHVALDRRAPPRRSSQARGHTAGSSPCVRLPLPRTPLTKRDPTEEGRRAAPCGPAPVNPTCFPRVSWSKRSMVTHGNYRRAWKGRYYGMLRLSSKTRRSNSDLHQHQKMHTSTNILRGCDTSS